MALSSKTILLAWEIGEGLGHLPPLKAIALAAKAEGASPVFALRETEPARTALADVAAPIHAAPFWPAPVAPKETSGSYADILNGNGFGSAANARTMIEGWDQLIDAVKPDLVVCEHAPGAALSAFGRIPVAFVGNGFVVPPADEDVFAPYEAARGNAQHQQPVLTAIQGALGDLGRGAPRTVTEPFRGAFRGVFTFPELDMYRGRRREAVLGPIEPVPPLSPLPAQRRLFAYSAADAALVGEFARALMDIGPAAHAYFRGTLGARAAVMRSRGVTVYDQAPRLGDVLPQASAVFSHGGSGFTYAAFAAGRPHIVYPRHYEALATARALEAIGAGLLFSPFDATRFREAVTRAHDRGMGEAAQKAGAAAQAFVAKAAPLETTMAALKALFR
jgi:hypothetical protein